MSYMLTVSIREDALWAVQHIKKHKLNMSSLVANLLIEYCQNELGEEVWDSDKPADPELYQLIIDNPKIPMENRLKAIHRLQEYRRSGGTLDLSDLEV